ncbi:MAG: aminotransferase class I/II-fold pyridoxal phosphate-dependent enzyme [Methanomassiliicoccus sp.]|jgi:aspartate/methionine/tyrosine aminotransferase|nr:aminotransferase class I/II-fold pyridoxal phosphate-dependent enzyme [Methanomassiliicoccus sp.]
MKATKRSMGVTYAIRDILLPARELEKHGAEIIKLHIGDPNKYDFETPRHVREALCRAVEVNDNGYAESEGDFELRRAILEKEKQKNGVEVDLDDCVITMGVTEAIQMVTAATVDPGDEVLVPGPGYPTYTEFTRFFGGVSVPYHADEANNWQPDIDDLRKKITPRTKCMVIINPNNPTGSLYSDKVLKEMTDLAGEHDLFVISDEIYDLMTFDGVHHSPASLNKDVPMILFNGFSKVDLLPGWRLGYTVFRDPQGKLDEIKEGMMRQLRLRISANNPCQMAVIEALKGPKDHLDTMNHKLKERRDYICKRINDIPGLSTTRPQAAFYIFPKIESKHWKNDQDFVLDVLKNCHVLLVPGHGFDETYGKMHFRATFLPPVETLGKAFDAIETYMHKVA